jgi:AraC-like DNA-binding protein
MQVANILGDQQAGRSSVADVAKSLRLSVRTLERNLARDGNSFRSLQDEALKRRFKRLAADPDLSLATIAERLGYGDESALSRATRRWFETTAAKARRDLFSLGVRAKSS